MSKLTDAVLALAEPVAAQQGCEIWDVEYAKEAGSRYLRVYIDKPDGVSIQDCEDFSRALDPILDEADPIPDSYIFEVSSAGAERQLKRPGDFERFLGAQAQEQLARAETLFNAMQDQGARLPGERRFACRQQSERQGVTISRSLHDEICALRP